MRNIEINLGQACNNRCVFCSNGALPPSERGWMRLEQIEAEMASARAVGSESIGFIGGEPTLFPQLVPSVRLARELGFRRIALCTNGSRLARPELLDRLLEAGITRITLSFHSHLPRLEEEITRRRGVFEEKVRAIDNLVAAHRASRLPDGFSLNVVWHRKLLPHLEALVSFFRSLGVRDLRFNFIRPENQAVGSRHWVPSFTESTRHIYDLIVSNERQFEMQMTFADVPLCKLPWEILANPPLWARYVGEVRDLRTDVAFFRPARVGGTSRFNWQDQRSRFLKCHLAVCTGCVHRGSCEGIWRAYLDIFGPREFDQGPAVAEAASVD